MLKITRRPYQACAYRWALSTSGIAVGEGDCSDEQCEELNGDFLLDFKPCISKGGTLVWEGDCEPPNVSDPSPCLICDEILNNNLPWTPPDVEYTEASATIVWGTDWTGVLSWSSLFYETTLLCEWRDVKWGIITTSDPDSVEFPPPDVLVGFPGGRKWWIETTPGVYQASLQLDATFLSASRRIDIYATLVDNEEPSGGTGSRQFFLATAYIGDPESCESPETYAVDSGATVATTEFDFSGDVAVTYAGEGGGTGPDKNDRIRSKWRLEWDIEEKLWTLRSFKRLDYPIYILSDSDPCTGFTKTLILSDKGDAADGCGIAPSEVTITRVCPPDRVAKSALLEDRKPNGATGKRKRQCGCDCLDEVDDRRHTCETKCASTESEGCGNINPAPDDITCRFPEAINCCENTAGKDVPCAYTVEFECDISYGGSGYGSTKIASKQVTLRRQCYFEDGCEYVAAGSEEDGFPGAQPVCSSCEDDCLTGCTWDAWTVAECPLSIDKCDIVPPVSRENCLEFRWNYVSTSGFTTGDVAAILHYVSQTVTPDGRFNWRFESDDGMWVANILPNTVTTCVAGSPPIVACGFGSLSWDDAPVDFPGSVNWLMQTADGTPVTCYSIHNSDIPFAYPEFGVDSTTLKMNWITCP